MAEPLREHLEVQLRTAVLVAVSDGTRDLPKEHALDELKALVKTAGVTVVGELVQNRSAPPRYLSGKREN